MATVLAEPEAVTLLQKIPGWTLTPDKKAITLSLKMNDFLAGVDLIKRIAEIAEKADHHPDIHLTGYRTLKIDLSTHDAGGLTPKDFSLASQINDLPKQLKA